MWSKIMIFTVAAIFLAALGTGVMATDGRIPNIIEDPGDTDEHPWGGENELIDDPVLTATPINDPFIEEYPFLFIRLSIESSWLSIKGAILDLFESRHPVTGVKEDITPISMPIDNNTVITDQGTRDK